MRKFRQTFVFSIMGILLCASESNGDRPNLVKLSFADFHELLPRVLPKSEVSVRVSPNRTSQDFSNLNLSCTLKKKEVSVSSVGLIVSNIFESHDGDVRRMEDFSLIQPNKRIVCLAIPFVRVDHELFSSYIPRFLQRLKILEAGGSSISQQHLVLLRKWCPDLIAIDLSDTSVTASELISIDGLSGELRAVSLGGIKGSTTEFSKLIEYWPDIEQLYLHGTLVDDSVFESLLKLNRLRVIDLSNTRVTEAGFLAYLTNAPKELCLERLYLPSISPISRELIVGRQPSLMIAEGVQ
jgi:hypothetical protein